MLRFQSEMGMDLGTTGIRAWVPTRGLVLDEPATVALNSETWEVVAVGNGARAILARARDETVLVQPVENGLVADIDATEALIRWAISKYAGSGFMRRLTMMFSVPAGATTVEKRALLEAAKNAGARKAYLIEAPLAAGLGMALPVTDAQGRLVLDFGGGKASAAVISVGAVVTSSSTNEAGNQLTEAIIKWTRDNYNLAIGTQVADKIKEKIGTATPDLMNRTMDIHGRDLISGMPTVYTISAEDVSKVIAGFLQSVVNLVKGVMETTPPELVSDVAASGIYVCGGGALLHHIDHYLARELGLDAAIAGDPRLTVVRGLGKALQQLPVLEKYLEKFSA